MKEKTLIILNGYYKNHLQEESEQSKIVGIFEHSTGIFKGIEILSSECNIGDYNELLKYICENYQFWTKFSLIAGYYDGEMLKYQGMLESKEISYGNFELDEAEKRFVGREKNNANGRLARNLARPVNRYDAIVLVPQILKLHEPIEFTKYFDQLYEVVETILMKANCNGTWKGIQISVENTFPKIPSNTYTLTSSTSEV